MNVYEEPQEGGGAPQKAKPEPVKEFKAMPGAERLLAAAAAAVIVAYLIRALTNSHYWRLAGNSWFDACALLGAIAVLALVVPQLFGVRLFEPRIRMYSFAVAGLLPAVGFVIEQFSVGPWHALMLAAGIAMGVTAWQIAERERLIK